MAEYGRIHTDGSRSGGQSAQSDDCPKCDKFGDDCGEHSPSWEELAVYWKAEAERFRQPTQSDVSFRELAAVLYRKSAEFQVGLTVEDSYTLAAEAIAFLQEQSR